jgi:ubiquinone/menaquinone biosynthesis C-methylase UbiE
LILLLGAGLSRSRDIKQPDLDTRATAGVGPPPSPKYNDGAVHFDIDRLPALLTSHLKPGPLALADLGCGDGPLFKALQQAGFIGEMAPVFAVDLEEWRLRKIAERFPYIRTLAAPADAVPIADQSLDFVVSTMLLEHVPDDVSLLREIKRILKPDGKAFLTTVFKKPWAWYFRRRYGKPVLDVSHIREYTSLPSFKSLVTDVAGLRLIQLELNPLWFPIVDPIAFRLARNGPESAQRVIRWMRRLKVPIVGYYSLDFVVAP